MFSTEEELKAINSYFREFVLLNKNNGYFYGPIEESLKKIEAEKEIDFNLRWEYLIVLMTIVEKVYDVKSIITERNYFRFEFHNDQNIQDKGETKIDALFSCCYQTLKKYWNVKAPFFNRGVEPFDSTDF